MKKRGRKWVWAGAIATILAVFSLALTFRFRDQPPYQFLHGSERAWTRIVPYPTIHDDSAAMTYVTDKSIAEVEKIASDELLPKGWTIHGGRFVSPGGLVETLRVGSGDAYEWEGSEWMQDKATINILRPATTQDRIRAWLDRVTGR